MPRQGKHARTPADRQTSSTQLSRRHTHTHLQCSDGCLKAHHPRPVVVCSTVDVAAHTHKLHNSARGCSQDQTAANNGSDKTDSPPHACKRPHGHTSAAAAADTARHQAYVPASQPARLPWQRLAGCSARVHEQGDCHRPHDKPPVLCNNTCIKAPGVVPPWPWQFDPFQ